MKTKHNGIKLSTAIKAIKDQNRKIAREQSKRDLLIVMTMKRFEFSGCIEFENYYRNHE